MSGLHTVVGRWCRAMRRCFQLIEMHALIAWARVRSGLFGPLDAVASSARREAVDLARHVGRSDAEQDVNAPLHCFDPDLMEAYLHAFAERCEALLLAQRYPANPGGHRLFCPRGCAECVSTAGWDECEACGHLMMPRADALALPYAAPHLRQETVS